MTINRRVVLAAAGIMASLIASPSVEAQQTRGAFRPGLRVVNPFDTFQFSSFTVSPFGLPTVPDTAAGVFAPTAPTEVDATPTVKKTAKKTAIDLPSTIVAIEEPKEPTDEVVAPPVALSTSSRPPFRPQVRSPFRPPPRPPFN